MNYYVSNVGNDDNIGSEDYPFETLQKVNNLSLSAGDQVLFRKGDIFRGCLHIVSTSGTEQEPIVFKSYGNIDDDLPEIRGSINRSLSGDWEQVEGNVWKLTNDLPEESYPNVIYNPSFDVDTSGWYVTYNSPASAVMVRDTTDYYSEPASVRIDCINSSSGTNDIQFLIYPLNLTIENRKFYELKFWAKADTEWSIPQISLFNGVNASFTMFQQNLKLSTNWHQYTLVFQSGFDSSATTDFSIFFSLGKNFPNGESVYFDDFSFKETNEQILSPSFDAESFVWDVQSNEETPLANVSGTIDYDVYDTFPASYRVDCIRNEDRTFAIQLLINNLYVEKDKTYKFSFKLKGSEKFLLTGILLATHTSGFHLISPSEYYLPVQTFWQEYVIYAKSTETSRKNEYDIEDVMLTFLLGNDPVAESVFNKTIGLTNGSSLWIDNASFKECKSDPIINSVGNVFFNDGITDSVGVPIFNNYTGSDKLSSLAVAGQNELKMNSVSAFNVTDEVYVLNLDNQLYSQFAVIERISGNSLFLTENLVYNFTTEATSVQYVSGTALERLNNQGDFWFDELKSQLYVYSTDNPGNLYDLIEIGLYNYPMLFEKYLWWKPACVHMNDCDHITLSGLSVQYAGGHAITFEKARNIKLHRNDINHIGGVWIDLPAFGIWRLGNAIELGGNCINMDIKYNLVQNVFDVPVTTQVRSGEIGAVAINHVFRYNIIRQCPGGFEFWMSNPEHIVSGMHFDNNVVDPNGGGWGVDLKQRITPSDPEGKWFLNQYYSSCFQMYYHAALSTHDITCRNNIFYEPVDSCISIQQGAWDWTSAVNINNNVYYQTSGNGYIAEWVGTNYPISSFSQYILDTGNDTSSVEGEDPNFIDRENLNYKIDYEKNQYSPVVNIGVNIGELYDWYGTSILGRTNIDAGIYQSQILSEIVCKSKSSYIQIYGPDRIRYGANKYINLVDYLPQYLQNSETEVFLKFFQDFLNTMFDGNQGYTISGIDLDINSLSPVSASNTKYYTFSGGTSAMEISSYTSASDVQEVVYTIPNDDVLDNIEIPMLSANKEELSQRISILQKVMQLTELQDPDLIDINYIQFFAKNLGYNINITRNQIGTGFGNISDLYEDSSRNTTSAYDENKYLRFVVRNLPTWYKIKTTNNAVKVMLYSFGLIGDLVEHYSNDYQSNWKIDNDGDLSQIPASYYPTSHFSVVINIDDSVRAVSFDYDKRQKIIDSIESVRPINTVFERLTAYAVRLFEKKVALNTRIRYYEIIK